MKPIKSIISAILIFAMLFTFIACNEDGSDTTAEFSTAPATAPESAADSATAKPEETNAPAEDSAEEPATEAPEEDTTKAPNTTKPVEDTTTVPAITAPVEDPSIDYSQWGKYGFEKMLPEPLPFSDQEADWHNARFDYAPNLYVIVSINRMYSTDEEREACCEILDEYANSLKKYGYDLYKTSRLWELTDNFNNVIAISLDDNDNNRIYVEITLAIV